MDLVLAPQTKHQSATCLQLTPGKGTTVHASAQLGKSRVHTHEHAFGAQIRTVPRQGVLLVGMIVSQNATIKLSGRLWHSWQVAFVSDAALDLCTLGAASYLWIEVPIECFIGELASVSLFEPVHTVRAVDRWAIKRLRRMCEDACRIGPRISPPIAESAVFEAVAYALRHSKQTQYNVAEACAADHRYRLVRRAEEYMWQHIDEPLTLARIAAALSCKVRTLVYSFHKACGIGPMTYFKRQRLNAVRQNLSRENRRAILDVASEYGFWHMGHFAKDYKELFGLSPSQTRSVHRNGTL